MADPVTLTTGTEVTAAMWNDIVNLLLALRAGNAVGAVYYTLVVRTTTYTAAQGDVVICTSGTFTVTLPPASGATKMIRVVNNGSGIITVGHSGTDTVGLAATQLLIPGPAGAQGDSMTFVSDGVSNWSIL